MIMIDYFILNNMSDNYGTDQSWTGGDRVGESHNQTGVLRRQIEEIRPRTVATIQFQMLVLHHV